MSKRNRKTAKAFPHVKGVRRHDGSVHYYHRVAKVRLPDTYGSPAFAEAWAAAERSIRAPAPRGDAPGTFADLCAAFEASNDWAALADRTRADYRKVRDWLLNQGAGRGFTRDLDQERAEKIIEAAIRSTHWRFAVYVLQYCRRVWNWSQEKAARKKRWGDGNPWRDIKAPKRPRELAARDVNRPWRPEEIQAVLERAPVGLRRAYVLGACGFDGGTMLGLTWADYDAGRGVFADKARVKTGVGGYSIVYPPLRPFLEDGERPSAAIVTTVHGAPFATVKSLQKRSSEFLRGLAATEDRHGNPLEPVVGEGLTLHGLRHTLAKAIADSGADLRAIQAALRHSTARMSLKYSDKASGKRAAETAAGAVELFFTQGKGGQHDG